MPFAVAVLSVLLLSATHALQPFIGEPSMWTVKISDNNCSKGQTPLGPSNASLLEGATGIYGCYATDRVDEDYYVTCNDTHLVSLVFKNSKRSEPCGGILNKTVVLPLGKCVETDWTGTVTGQTYTYNCQGMWCNSTCDRPPCPLDFPCPQETYCCLNDNSFDVPCGTEAGCTGEVYQESWFWGLLRKVLLLGIVVCGVMYAWQMGYCNICPWRRPYSTLYGEMA